jgi:hypothetical protein
LGFERGAMKTLMRHPSLLVEAVRTWFALSRRGGIGPDPAYLQWRAFTAYGDHSATASAHDLLYYLSWRRQMRGVRKWGQLG